MSANRLEETDWLDEIENDAEFEFWYTVYDELTVLFERG